LTASGSVSAQRLQPRGRLRTGMVMVMPFKGIWPSDLKLGSSFNWILDCSARAWPSMPTLGRTQAAHSAKSYPPQYEPSSQSEQPCVDALRQAGRPPSSSEFPILCGFQRDRTPIPGLALRFDTLYPSQDCDGSANFLCLVQRLGHIPIVPPSNEFKNRL